MTSKRFLIFDMGSSHGRALISEFDGNTFKIFQIHEFENTPVLVLGTLYWDIKRLYHEMKISIKMAFNMYRDIKSLGICTWGVDFSFINKKNRLLSDPIHYRDKGRYFFYKSLFNIIEKKELYLTIGGCLHPISSIFNLFYLKKIGAYELANAYKLLMIPDLFNFFLTGEIICEFSEAATTFLFDIENNKWEYELIKKVGLPVEIFPEVSEPGKVIGKIRANIANELNISKTKVVLPVTHDTCSAVAGLPIKDHKKTWGFISIGTWCTMGIEMDDLIIKEKFIETGFYYESGAEGKKLLVRNITGLWVIQQCRKNWIKNNNILSWEEIEKLANEVESLRSIINIDNNLFTKLQPNMSLTIKKYCNKYNIPEPNSIGEIARTIYESLAFRIRFFKDVLEDLINKKIEVFYIVGGGSKSFLLSKSISNAINTPVYIGPGETTSHGNIIMQLIADKEIKDLKQGRQLSLASSKIEYYEPRCVEKWNYIYQKKYLGILKKEKLKK